MVRLCEEALNKAASFNSQGIANTLNAMAKFEHRHDELMVRLCEEALNKAASFNSQDIANTLNAMAKLDFYNDATLSRLCAESMIKSHDFSAQQLAMSVWAVLCLGSAEGMCLVKVLWHRLSEPGLVFSQLECRTLHHCRLCLSIEYPDLELTLPAELTSRCAKAWEENLPSISDSSKFHLQVSETLHAMGIPHHNEHVVGGFSVDITIDAGALSGDKACVVEVDGPSHFSCTTAAGGEIKELGTTVFKRRLLKGCGVAVVNVVYWEWDELRTSKERQAYINKKLGVL
jgi:hypothetical protein